MKRFFFIAAALLIAGLALQAQDFDKAWKDSEFAAKFGTDLYNGAVRPIYNGVIDWGGVGVLRTRPPERSGTKSPEPPRQ